MVPATRGDSVRGQGQCHLNVPNAGCCHRPSCPPPRCPQEHPGGAGRAQPHLERGDVARGQPAEAWGHSCHPADRCHLPCRHWCGRWVPVPCAPRPAWPCASGTGASQHPRGEWHPWVGTAGCCPQGGRAHRPCPPRELGATTVPLGRLAEEPGLPLALSHLPLLDPRGRPTGATVTVRCSYIPPGQVAAGDTAPHQQGRVAPCLSPPCLSPAVGTAVGVPPGPPHHHAKPVMERKEDFQVGHPRVRWHLGRCPKQWPPCPHVSRRCG